MESFKNTISIEDFYKSDMTLMSLPNDEPLFKLIQKNNKLYTMFLLQNRVLFKEKLLIYVTEIKIFMVQILHYKHSITMNPYLLS